MLRRRALRIGVFALALVLVVLVVFAVLGRSWIAHGIVVAPNSHKAFNAADDARVGPQRPSSGSEHVRVGVAPVSDYVELYAPILGKLLPRWFVQQAVDQAGSLAHFDPDDASPLAAIQRSSAQVLLIHGLLDRHIPPNHSSSLHHAAPTRSRLILVGAEGHDSIAADRTRTIANQGMEWLRRWLDSAVPAHR